MHLFQLTYSCVYRFLLSPFCATSKFNSRALIVDNVFFVFFPFTQAGFIFAEIYHKTIRTETWLFFGYFFYFSILREY